MSDLLYHGTTLKRWAGIQEVGAIMPARTGVKMVSMTTKREVADYFANNSNSYDKTGTVILQIDANALEKDGYVLEEFSDPVWGEGQCDWENEVICETQIPLSYVTRVA